MALNNNVGYIAHRRGSTLLLSPSSREHKVSYNTMICLLQYVTLSFSKLRRGEWDLTKGEYRSLLLDHAVL